MPVTKGFNHVATLTSDMDRTVKFYRDAFEADRDVRDAGTRRPSTNDDPRPRWRCGPQRVRGRRPTTSSANVASKATVARSTTTRSRSSPKDVLERIKSRMVDAGAEIGEIQRLGDEWSLFFRDPDGMELEVCAKAT